jgi:hypothetical protein
MGDLLVPLEVVGALIMLVVAAFSSVVLRRRWLSNGAGAFDCSLRSVMAPHGKGWTLGIARYQSDRIEWFRVFDLSPRPRQILFRSDLMVQDRRSPRGVEAFAVMTGFVIVSCRRGTSFVELAMSEQAYTGFASWLESAPPGQNVSVA